MRQGCFEASITPAVAVIHSAGVGIGTTLRRALALCPKAVFLPHREALAGEVAGGLPDPLPVAKDKRE